MLVEWLPPPMYIRILRNGTLTKVGEREGEEIRLQIPSLWFARHMLGCDRSRGCTADPKALTIQGCAPVQSVRLQSTSIHSSGILACGSPLPNHDKNKRSRSGIRYILKLELAISFITFNIPIFITISSSPCCQTCVVMVAPIRDSRPLQRHTEGSQVHIILELCRHAAVCFDMTWDVCVLIERFNAFYAKRHPSPSPSRYLFEKWPLFQHVLWYNLVNYCKVNATNQMMRTYVVSCCVCERRSVAGIRLAWYQTCTCCSLCSLCSCAPRVCSGHVPLPPQFSTLHPRNRVIQRPVTFPDLIQITTQLCYEAGHK